MKRTNYNPVYILCGGKSSRMKAEKGLVNFRGKPFVQHIIETAKKITDEIYLVTKNEEYQKFGLPLIPDLYLGQGPLAGIHAALNHTTADAVLILSCDIPLLATEVLDEIISVHELNPGQLLLASGKDQKQPLIAMYPRILLDEITSRLEKGHNKLLDFVNAVTHTVVDITDERAVQNINTPEALINIENDES
ncbi:MAG: molybdenum cofactor guanylyltransferase [Leeuwenhoekiella sp.]